PTLFVTVASLIALGGPLLAAPETTHARKPVASAAKKDAAKHAAGRPAAAHKRAGKAGKHAAEARGKGTASTLARPLPPPRPATTMVLASADSQPVIARPSLAAPITTTTSQTDLSAVREALTLIQQGKISAVADVKQQISDPAALKLIEWSYLRSASSQAGFE